MLYLVEVESAYDTNRTNKCLYIRIFNRKTYDAARNTMGDYVSNLLVTDNTD